MRRCNARLALFFTLPTTTKSVPLSVFGVLFGHFALPSVPQNQPDRIN
jgi:hypothetical protein